VLCTIVIEKMENLLNPLKFGQGILQIESNVVQGFTFDSLVQMDKQ
jgi:hypothetical protein